MDGLEKRPKRIVEVGGETAGQIPASLRVAWIMEACPLAIFSDILGNAGEFVRCRMFGQYRREGEYDRKTLEGMVAGVGLVHRHGQERPQQGFELVRAKPVELALVK